MYQICYSECKVIYADRQILQYFLPLISFKNIINEVIALQNLIMKKIVATYTLVIA